MNLLNTFLLTCSHKEFIAAGTELLITCTTKLINMAFCAKCFRFHTITKCSRWYSTLWLSITDTISAHLAAPLRHCQFTSTQSQTFVTSCLEKRLRVHLRGWGGSNSAVTSWSQNLKNVYSETPNFYNTFTWLVPMSNKVAITTSPALWQVSRTSFKKITSISHLVLPQIK